jgi:transposase
VPGSPATSKTRHAWLATHTSKWAITQLLRIARITVGRIIARVIAERGAGVAPLDGLVRIGIDEISHRTGQRYLTVVVDHDSGRLVWAPDPGRDRATVAALFDDLGAQRCARIRLVSADAADWISDVVAVPCPTAVRCMDPVSRASAAVVTDPRRGLARPRCIRRPQCCLSATMWSQVSVVICRAT